MIVAPSGIEEAPVLPSISASVILIRFWTADTDLIALPFNKWKPPS
jgi:hypothetical protein